MWNYIKNLAASVASFAKKVCIAAVQTVWQFASVAVNAAGSTLGTVAVAIVLTYALGAVAIGAALCGVFAGTLAQQGLVSVAMAVLFLAAAGAYQASGCFQTGYMLVLRWCRRDIKHLWVTAKSALAFFIVSIMVQSAPANASPVVEFVPCTNVPQDAAGFAASYAKDLVDPLQKSFEDMDMGTRPAPIVENASPKKRVAVAEQRRKRQTFRRTSLEELLGDVTRKPSQA